VNRVASLSLAFIVAILTLGVGTARGFDKTRSAASAKQRCSEVEARGGQLHDCFIIAPRAELIFQVPLPMLTFEVRIAFKEELIFYVAEHLHGRKLYPKAADFYRRLLASPKRRYRQQALQRLYEIANYWLRDSWEVVKQSADFERPRWLSWIDTCDFLSDILPDSKDLYQKVLFCRNLLHWDESKPFFNEEGRAIELLQCVHDHDPAGPFADKTLYLMGYVGWFHEDYRRADECFSRLEKKHPTSGYYPYALELAVKAKLMRDEIGERRRQLVEARRLIHKVLQHPRLSEEKKNGVMRCLSCVLAGLADLDFQDAEKCQKAGRLDEARSRFQKICEDYPGSYDAERAKKRLRSLRGK
jgi:tetratricopeptide (TPR) repeat protein